MATDYTQSLSDAVAAFRKDADVSAFQSVYRAIPAAARAKAQIDVLMANPDLAMDILSMVNDLPASTTSRAKQSLSDAEKQEIRARIGVRLSDADLSQSDDSPLMAETLAATVAKVLRYIDGLSVGSDRAVHDVSVTDIVPAGSTVTGKVNGQSVTGKVNDDGTVTVGKDTGTLSAIAGKLLGRNQNGWAFWRYDGATLANLRDNANA